MGDLTSRLYRTAPPPPATVAVQNPVAAFLRLMGWLWVLARHDALVPREVTPLLPAWTRPFARFVQLFSGRAGRQGRPGQRLGAAFEHLGPVAIKLGQVLATRADIFGLEFARDLGRLKDRLPPFPLEDARREIERSLGRPVESLFTDLGPAVAAASLAQAHRATLADGRAVAVKVLRPGVERRVANGLDSMRLAARLVWRLVPMARRLEPSAFVETIANSLDLELDMRLEAAAASEMAEVMAKDGYMSAPAVIWDGVGKRVLTLEWAQGVPMTDPALLDLPGLDKDQLADNVVRAFLVQALDHGTFHADLHEGNLFASAPAHLTAIDFGIVGRLGPAERRYLAEILWGFISRDYDRISRVHFEAGYVPPHHSVETFAQALRAVGEPVIGRAASQVSMGRLLGQLFEITALFDMRLRPELILLQKTMVSVEGVARRLQPDHDLWKAAQPVVERWIRRELGPQAQARDALNDMIAAARAISRLVSGAAASNHGGHGKVGNSGLADGFRHRRGHRGPDGPGPFALALSDLTGALFMTTILTKTLLGAALILAPAPALAQAAAASVPNAFDRPAQTQSQPQVAPTRPAPAGPPATSAATPAAAPDIARAEEALRGVIADVQGGGFDYSDFTPNLAAQIRQQAEQVGSLIKGFGAVKTVEYKRQEGEAQLFKVTFDNQATEWLIGFDAEDKIAALLFRPAES